MNTATLQERLINLESQLKSMAEDNPEREEITAKIKSVKRLIKMADYQSPTYAAGYPAK